MDIETAEQIVESLEDEGRNASLRDDYSGRGMYGEGTAAVVTDEPAGVGLIFWAAGRAEVEFYEVERFRTDRIGLGTVVY